MHFHMQNLNEDNDGNPVGSPFWHGRWWLEIGRSQTYVSWLNGRRQHSLFFMLNWREEDGYGFSFAIPFLVSLWVYFKHSRLPRPTRSYDWNIFEIRLSEEYIWLNIWNSDDYPRPRHYALDWKRLLFGRTKFEQFKLEERRVSITLIDGQFPARATLTRSEWSRPRLPGKIRRVYVKIEPDTPIPIPGKGENSYDLDDDAIWSTSVQADTIPEGVQKIRENILKRRERYGGKHWKPDSQ